MYTHVYILYSVLTFALLGVLAGRHEGEQRSIVVYTRKYYLVVSILKWDKLEMYELLFFLFFIKNNY